MFSGNRRRPRRRPPSHNSRIEWRPSSRSPTQPSANIYYTLDGAHHTSSQNYQAPFLVASSITVKAIAATSESVSSAAATSIHAKHRPRNPDLERRIRLPRTARAARSNPWTYDTGNRVRQSRAGNLLRMELERVSLRRHLIGKSFVATQGDLHIVARQPSPGVYTSARLKSQGCSALCTAASRRA